jgi:isopenicillin N synthase-like dioxygenase
MMELSRQLLRAFALALNLPQTYLDSATEKPVTEMFLIHYPPQVSEQPVDPHSIGTYHFFLCIKLIARGDISHPMQKICNP